MGERETRGAAGPGRRPATFQDLYIPSDERPRTVVLDPRGWILKTRRLRQAGRRVGRSSSTVQAPRRPARGDPRPGRPRRRRGRGGARPGPARGALPRRPAGGREGPGQDRDSDPALEALRAGLGRQGQPGAQPPSSRALGELPRSPRADPACCGEPWRRTTSYAARAAAAGALGELREAGATRWRPCWSRPSPRRASASRSAARRSRPWPRSIPPAPGTPPSGLAKYGAPIDSRADALEALVALQKQATSGGGTRCARSWRAISTIPSYSAARERLPAARRAGRSGRPSPPSSAARALRGRQARQRRNAEKAIEKIRARRSEGEARTRRSATASSSSSGRRRC